MQIVLPKDKLEEGVVVFKGGWESLPTCFVVGESGNERVPSSSRATMVVVVGVVVNNHWH